MTSRAAATRAAGRREWVTATVISVALLEGVTGCAAAGGSDDPSSPTDRGASSTPSPTPPTATATATATATGGADDMSPGSDPAAIGGQWTLVSLTDSQGTVRMPLPAPTIDLRRYGAMSGSGGCNTYTARYRTSSGLEVVDVISTQLACDRSSALESRYFAVLRAVDDVSASADKLSLTSPDGRLTFNRDETLRTG